MLYPSELVFCIVSLTPEQLALGSGSEARRDTSVADTAASVCFPGKPPLFVADTGSAQSWEQPLGSAPRMSLGQEGSPASSSPLSWATGPCQHSPSPALRAKVSPRGEGLSVPRGSSVHSQGGCLCFPVPKPQLEPRLGLWATDLSAVRAQAPLGLMSFLSFSTGFIISLFPES